MTKAKTSTSEVINIHGEVTISPALVSRTNKKGGTFYTTQLRYVDLNDDSFGRASAIFDVAEAVVDNARVGGQFKAECTMEGEYTNIQNIRFMD